MWCSRQQKPCAELRVAVSVDEPCFSAWHEGNIFLAAGVEGICPGQAEPKAAPLSLCAPATDRAVAYLLVLQRLWLLHD